MKLSRRLGFGLLVLMALSGWGRAQDITAQGPQWLPEGGHPQVLPELRRLPKLPVPESLEKAAEPYYAIIEQKLNYQGGFWSFVPFATHPSMDRLSYDSLPDWRFKPAQQKEKPVAGMIWTALISNPRSAGSRGATATPRVLQVAPIGVPLDVWGDRQKPVLVRARLALDQAGVLQGVTVLSPEDEIFLPAIKQSLDAWRFAPARREGRAVASELSMGLVVAAPLRSVPGLVPPKIKHHDEPSYPVSMQGRGLKGFVSLSFQVELDGKVSNAVVVNSSHPGFDEVSVAALLNCRYEPGKIKGQPTVMTMQKFYLFSSSYAEDGGREAMTATAVDAKRQEKLPPQFRYDVAPRPIGVVTPVYPHDLLPKGAEGKVTLVVMLSEEGVATMSKVMAATQPEFGLALAAAFEAFAFEPATRAGEPTPTLVTMVHEFAVKGDVYEDRALLRSLEKHPEKIVPGNKLDAPLKPLSRRAPVYPRKESFQLTTGQAVIEFVVDEEGKVRLPRIVSATQPEFGYAAVQAVSVWRFEPPKLGGKKVMTRASIPIDFVPDGQQSAGKS